MGHSRAYIIWTKIGHGIANHMLLIMPVCLALGIFLPDLLSPLRPAVPVLFAIMSFQGSLENDFAHLKNAVRHPAPILTILIFAQVIVPILACIVGNFFFADDPNIVAGIILEYCVPVAASTVMWVTIYQGSIAITVTTILISSLVSPFSIPLTMHLLTGTSVQVDTLGIIANMIFMVAIPAVVALFINEGTHGWGKRTLSPLLAPLSRIVMPVIITVNTTAISAYVFNLTPELLGVIVFIGAFAVFNFLMGIGIGKLFHFSYEQCVPVIFGCGMRNISSGAVIAMQYFPPATVFPVMAAVLYQQFLAALFGKIVKRILRGMPRHKDAQPPR